MKRTPYVIGLTGNIATGKTAATQILAELGAQVIDADRVAHDVMQPGGPVFDVVVEAFGREILGRDGRIDRARLGATVFRDSEALRRLEAAVHPAVTVEVKRRISEATQPVVVVEAIKLIEAGMHHRYDALWVVTARRETQIQRLIATRGLSREEAALRVDAQPPQEEKTALADIVLRNDGTWPELRQKVEAAWAEVQECTFDRPGRAPGPAPPATSEGVTIRPARREDIADAGGVANVLNSVIQEGGRTVLTGHWTAEAEQSYLMGLGPRSEITVAEIDGCIVGFQIIEPYVTYTSALDHVATIGTYILASRRRRGIGQKLADATFAFARAHGYEKSVVSVLAGNRAGLAYYRKLGFTAIGVLERQARIDGVYYDAVAMELHFCRDQPVTPEVSRV